MSRGYYSYNEDWQRRKATLIRSLFHDIPILSPVPEESNESSILFNPTEDILEVPPQPLNGDDRPDSPLPPLIIERVPNRHDEPEEYYKQLLKKIKRIYRELFIENKDLSEEDLNLISSVSSINDDHFDMSVDNYENDGCGNFNLDLNDTKGHADGNGNFDSLYDNRESSNSINSNGYGADYESYTSNTECVDVENYSKSEEDVPFRYDEEELSNEQEMSGTENTIEFGKDQGIHETTGSYKVNGEDHMEAEESSHPSDEETNETEQSNHGQIEEEQSNIKTESSNTIMENTEFNDDIEDNNIAIDYQEINENGKSNNTVINNVISDLKSKKREHENFDNENQFILAHSEPMEQDIEAHTSSDVIDYMQITTKALVHVDGHQDAVERESRVYEDSVKSLILTTREFRRMAKARNNGHEDIIEELSALEDNDDPDTTLESVESEHIFEPIEVMRTPQPKISNESIPITALSEPDITIENTGILENAEMTSVTSSPQDGGKDMSKPKTSDEMNDILTLIFNESRNEAAKSPLSRKRKLYEDISVQTSQRVSWNDLRENFFVGTPKVFRLCACADHVCY